MYKNSHLEIRTKQTANTVLIFGSLPKAQQKVNNSYSVGVSQAKGTLTLTHVHAIIDVSRHSLVELEEAWESRCRNLTACVTVGLHTVAGDAHIFFFQRMFFSLCSASSKQARLKRTEYNVRTFSCMKSLMASLLAKSLLYVYIDKTVLTQTIGSVWSIWPRTPRTVH